MLRSLIFLLTLITLPLYAAPQMHLIFGDSLSDEGRVYQLTDQAYPPLPFYEGRFSNGPVWTEYMEGERQNYAVAGATSTYDNVLTDTFPQTANTGLQAQVDAFLASDYDRATLAKTTVYINIGGNDFLAAMSGSSTQLERLIPNVVDNIIDAAKRVRAAGAQEIVLFGLPNLATIPRMQEYSREQKQLFGFISWKFNQNLMSRAAINRFTYIDVMAFMDQIQDPKYQFKSEYFTKACLNVEQMTVCENPEEYLFWDDIHPTTRVYQILAAELWD